MSRPRPVASVPGFLAAAILAAVAFATAAPAQDTPDGQAKPPARRGLGGLLDRAGDRLRDEAMKRIDTNGDGRIDDVERARATDALKKKGVDLQGQLWQFMLRRYDADKDGTLDETERKTALDEAMKQLEQNGPMVKSTILGMVHQRFDTDRDGTLGIAELKAARDELTDRLLRAAPTATVPAAPSAGRDAADGEARRRSILDHFDDDGDGVLDDAERARAREELRRLSDDLGADEATPADR